MSTGTRPSIAAPPLDGTAIVARNVSTRYLAIGVEAALGLVMLPFNIAHLGQAAYGLWALTASVTAYFSILDLGYSGAVVKFVAQYRARRDERSLNEILSTSFWLFAAVGACAYLLIVVLAMNLGSVFQLTPDQIATGRAVLLIVGAQVAAGLAFSVFGGVINGFQRYDLNNVVGTASALVAAGVNVAVLSSGYGLVPLVAATTAVRLLTYFVYRANAYRVFPDLRLSWAAFRRDRLKELTRFSVYMAVIDWANRLNYAADALVIGIFLGPGAVAVWSVGQRVAELAQRLSNQLNEVLFPAVVDSDTTARLDRLQTIFVQGTRLSLATVIPLAGGLILMAHPLVTAWVGANFAESALVLQLLAATVIVRVGQATSTILLRGSGGHRLVAATNASAALCNLALSVAMVGPYGLRGVALGTLAPVLLAAVVMIFPAASRRAGLPLRRALSSAVWPAVWPASVMVLFLLATRSLAAPSLFAIAAELVAAGAVYLAVFFFFSISSRERQFYLAKGEALVARWRLQPASEGA